MKWIFTSLMLSMMLFSCSDDNTSDSKTLLSPQEFQSKMEEFDQIQLIDVRTPGEFAGGFIQNAINLDYNSADFSRASAKLDKQKPVFVYCLSGGRSASAASDLRGAGFEQVFELDGGLMNWNAKELPVVLTNESSGTSGMRLEDYEKAIQGDLVLVDFHAEWCAPCKKLAPIIEALELEMKGKLKVLRVDVDENSQLAKQMKIESIPLIVVYKAGKMHWSGLGLVEKEELRTHLN